ncbi:hypothetical protein Vadar_025710 [Vaccinium darrowii]|uniref:Uncharacterized protein n=1 Tax=Vaccinium darrowii TaxID=229202 RepID=A0ACB7YQ07_9ERIC|nr:hypothetical protein Vadar_025710 [Vaccinium darrowii]
MYLGCPIHHSRPNRHSFQFLIDKVRAKLASWKSKCLSFAGRVTLVKSVNEAIPAYVMQCNLLPTSVAKSLDKLNWDFIWDSTVDKKKTHAVKWSNVTKDKRLGGLGLRDAVNSNFVSMAKLNWRFLKEDDSLWARVLRGKYGSPTANHYSPSYLLRSLCKGYPLLVARNKRHFNSINATNDPQFSAPDCLDRITEWVMLSQGERLNEEDEDEVDDDDDVEVDSGSGN